MSDLESLRLEELHEHHPGLTQALGQSYAEAAFVYFSRHHQPPVTLSLKHTGNDELRVVNFVVPDERVRNAHANEIDATETGAYGVSLAAVEAVAGLVAVRRAETLTGADWGFLYIAAKRIIPESQLQNISQKEILLHLCFATAKMAQIRPPACCRKT